MIALYVRVSTQEQALNGHSIDEQTDRLKKYCDALNLGQFKAYTDAGFSGSNMNRPALQQMIKDISGIEKVIVYKLDRLSRSQKDTLYLIEDVFLANGCDFVSMSENFDTSSAFGRAMIGILSVFAQLEREQIKERLMMGKFARAKQGAYSSSKSPIGYDYINGELVTNESEKTQIKTIFDRYSAGCSIKAITKELNNSGFSHKYGKWQTTTVRSLLESRIYLGYNKYNGEWYKGNHEPFITEKQFNEVQAILQRRTKEHSDHNRRSGKANSFLGGYLYCAKCGAKYSKQRYQSTVNGKGYFYNYYVCNSRSKKTPHLVHDPNCKNKNWKMEELDNLVFNEIKKIAVEPIEEYEEIKPDFQKEIQKINDQMQKLMDLYAVDGMPFDILSKRIKELNDRKTKLETEQLRPIRTVKPEIIRSMAELLDQSDFDQKRQIIGTLIDKIEIDGEDITIYWNF